MKNKRKIARRIISDAADHGRRVLEAWKEQMALRYPEPRMVLNPAYAWRAVSRLR